MMVDLYGMEIEVECPLCQGTGEIEQQFISGEIKFICTLCKGKKVITAIGHDEFDLDIEPCYNEGYI